MIDGLSRDWNKERAYALATYIFSHRYQHSGMTDTYHPMGYDTFGYFNPDSDNDDVVATIAEEMFLGLGDDNMMGVLTAYHELIEPAYMHVLSRHPSNDVTYRPGTRPDDGFMVGYFDDESLDRMNRRRKEILRSITRGDYRPEIVNSDEEGEEWNPCCTPSRHEYREPKRRR